MPEGLLSENNANLVENDEDTRNKYNSKSLAHSNTFNTKPIAQDVSVDDSRSCLSVKSATLDKQYKPRAGSLAAHIMIGIRLLGRG
jgi:hypothetical protein